MLTPFARYWWILFTLGLSLIGLGAFMFVDPDTGILEIMRYLGFVFIGMGVFTALISFFASKGHDWRLYLLAAAELAVGIIIIMNDEWAEQTFVQLMATWSGLMGIYLVYNGLRNKGSKSIVVLAGIVSIAFAAFIFFDILSDDLATLIALYSIVLGLYIITLSFSVRGYSNKKTVSEKEATMPTAHNTTLEEREDKETSVDND